MPEQIENNFKYHAPTSEKIVAHGALREETKDLALVFDAMLPPSREKALAMTKLEEALMWANAAVARN